MEYPQSISEIPQLDTAGSDRANGALGELQAKLGYTFKRIETLLQALTHTSYGHEFLQVQRAEERDNERMEFLGDAILALLLSARLLERFPEANEGELSKMRAGIVNEKTLASLAAKIELNQYIRLGKGESLTRGHQKPSILSSGFEALAAALYLDGGFGAAQEVLLRLFDPILDSFESRAQWVNNLDSKTRLQEMSQARFRQAPTYNLLRSHGPDHAKIFEVEVKIGQKVLGEARGTSKKQAEQAAARVALEVLMAADQPTVAAVGSQSGGVS